MGESAEGGAAARSLRIGKLGNWKIEKIGKLENLEIGKLENKPLIASNCVIL